MSSVLSEKIALLRKERGFTQEQLGQLLGVSAQAVSKWEKGGAPDVELLPLLSNHLGVTIDTLFDRGEQRLETFPDAFRRWLKSLQADNDQFHELFTLLGKHFHYLRPELNETTLSTLSIASSCYYRCPDDETTLIRSKAITESGMVLGVLSEELPLFLLLPEPPAGYERHFLDNETYRRLFSALATEGSLEILRYLCGQKDSYYTASAVSKRTGLSLGTALNALAALRDCHLLQSKPLELDDSTVDAYTLHDNSTIVPFLYLARWLTEKEDAWMYYFEKRERPILALSAKQKELLYESKA